MSHIGAKELLMKHREEGEITIVPEIEFQSDYITRAQRLEIEAGAAKEKAINQVAKEWEWPVSSVAQFAQHETDPFIYWKSPKVFVFVKTVAKKKWQPGSYNTARNPFFNKRKAVQAFGADKYKFVS